MPLCDIVHEKRKELGLTQDQLAEYLGVSAPAVNKWEKGVTYPDIVLLPALARLLKTDLNTLLCFEKEISEQERSRFLNEVAEKIKENGYEAGFELGMSKVFDYPNCADFIYPLTMMLDGALILTGYNESRKMKYKEKIFALYERVANGENEKLAEGARYLLASKLINDDKLERAQEVLDALPERSPLDKRALQADILIKNGEYTKAAKLIEQRLINSLQENQRALEQLAKISIKEGDDENANRLAETAMLQNEAYGFWEYSSYVVWLTVALEQKDAKKVTATLKRMFEAIAVPWLPENSPIYKHMSIYKEEIKGDVILAPLIAELENNLEYDFMRDDVKFNELIKEYKGKCETLQGD